MEKRKSELKCRGSKQLGELGLRVLRRCRRLCRELSVPCHHFASCVPSIAYYALPLTYKSSCGETGSLTLPQTDNCSNDPDTPVSIASILQTPVSVNPSRAPGSRDCALDKLSVRPRELNDDPRADQPDQSCQCDHNDSDEQLHPNQPPTMNIYEFFATPSSAYTSRRCSTSTNRSHNLSTTSTSRPAIPDLRRHASRTSTSTSRPSSDYLPLSVALSIPPPVPTQGGNTYPPVALHADRTSTSRSTSSSAYGLFRDKGRTRIIHAQGHGKQRNEKLTATAKATATAMVTGTLDIVKEDSEEEVEAEKWFSQVEAML